MLKDRGNKKWTSLMLPEHVRQLRIMAKELNKIPQPTIDEQQLEEFERKISEAIEIDQTVTIFYWESGEIYIVEGKIQGINRSEKMVKLIKEDERIAFISFYSVIEIEFS
ncbi:YolD-like family protein [Alkalihalobacterium elongatum]|uniref:YolD-like family protein n=1 Tax=Alkalihalobacterium elongatum TaxID=2675466 RepID=UPI001C1F67A3|nr:YolD-like family protein [Alkalihalobacterium elongatum]